MLVIAATSDSNAGPLYRATAARRKQLVVLPESALEPNMFGLSMWTAGAAWAQKALRAKLLLRLGTWPHQPGLKNELSS